MLNTSSSFRKRSLYPCSLVKSTALRTAIPCMWTLVQLLYCRFCNSEIDLEQDFSGLLLSTGVSDLLKFDDWDCWSNSTSKTATGCSSLTEEMPVGIEISSTKLSTSWTPNSLQPDLLSCFLSLRSHYHLTKSIRLIVVVDQCIGLLADDGSIEQGFDANGNKGIGQDCVWISFSPCGPENEIVWVFSTDNFRKPGKGNK